jgi:DNA-binding response OmpR family regulator
MPEYQVLVLTGRESEGGSIPFATKEEGLSFTVAGDLESTGQEERPDVALLFMESLTPERAKELVSQCRESRLPVLAALPAERVGSYDPSINPDDFILYPFRPGELYARVRQVVLRLRGPESPRLVRIGDLVIDPDRYEVRVGGRRVLLTYKEYQLLLLLASNPGRVYSRETLLSRVWGYDYFGGTRTVDVHIRRLRAKLEDANHTFIETIWNVGYRFKGGP